MKTNTSFIISRSMPKYKNISLVPVNDPGYQLYRHTIIANKKADRFEKNLQLTSSETSSLIELPKDPICEISKTVEYIIRRYYASDQNRIIKFDCLYQGQYHTQYLECDFVKLLRSGEIVIGEVKTSLKTTFKKSIPQLRKRFDVLSQKFSKIIPVSIVVACNDSEIQHGIFLKLYRSDNFIFKGAILSLDYLKTMAHQMGVKINDTLFDLAHNFKSLQQVSFYVSPIFLENKPIDTSFSTILQQALKKTD